MRALGCKTSDCVSVSLQECSLSYSNSLTWNAKTRVSTESGTTIHVSGIMPITLDSNNYSTCDLEKCPVVFYVQRFSSQLK